MFIEAAIIAALVGLGSATGVHQTREPGVCTTASITEEEFKKSMEESKKERDRSLLGPRKRLN
ncbi:MAG: hypothetical protein LBI70_00590 [Rickettsiales bacterium]|jgi:hypothetical protein|nr:hypothetical protein [Rickettsiales bacterium]